MEAGVLVSVVSFFAVREVRQMVCTMAACTTLHGSSVAWRASLPRSPSMTTRLSVASRRSPVLAFHLVMTERVKAFVIEAYVRGAEVGCAERAELEGLLDLPAQATRAP